jgi:hypothetical protein
VPFVDWLGDGDGLGVELEVGLDEAVAPELDDVAVAGRGCVVVGATDAPEESDPVRADRWRTEAGAGRSGTQTCGATSGRLTTRATVALGVASGTATSPEAGWT